MRIIVPIVVLFLSLVSFKIAEQDVSFPSLDGLPMTADVYHIKYDAPVILLCHQASYSRGEYIETAKKLNELGFNCIAIDQRSGSTVNNVQNKTAYAAISKGLPRSYLDAEQDIVAGLEYAFRKYNKKIILLGSSYSASLVLKIANESDKVSAVISFSPGEYFGPALKVKESIKGLAKPVFITSSKKESHMAGALMGAINASIKEQFIPTESGVHGSRALWASTPNNKEYWDALKPFLEKIK